MNNPYEKYGKIVHVSKKSPICNFVTQEQANRLYILLEGKCSLSVFSESGKEKVLLYFHEGDFVNYVPILSVERDYNLRFPSYSAAISTYAKTDSTLVRISHSAYDELKRSTRFRDALFDNMLRHYRELIMLQQAKANKSAVASVSSFILYYSTRDDDGLLYLDGFFTFSEIGKALELHPVSVGRIIGALRSEGVVERQGRRLAVVDSNRLCCFAEESLTLRY